MNFLLGFLPGPDSADHGDYSVKYPDAMDLSDVSSEEEGSFDLDSEEEEGEEEEGGEEKSGGHSETLDPHWTRALESIKAGEIPKWVSIFNPTPPSSPERDVEYPSGLLVPGFAQREEKEKEEDSENLMEEDEVDELGEWDSEEEELIAYPFEIYDWEADIDRNIPRKLIRFDAGHAIEERQWEDLIVWEEEPPQAVFPPLILDGRDPDLVYYTLEKEEPPSTTASSQVVPRRFIRWVLKKPNLKHSPEAMRLETFKTFLDANDLMDFHRPKLTRPRGVRVNGGSAQGDSSIHLEYLEEFPPLLNQTGMCIELINFHRDPTRKEQDGQYLDPEYESSPFVGNVGTEPIPTVSCNMFRAPYTAYESSSSDFILSLSTGQLSEYPKQSLVLGQQIPLHEVPTPCTKPANDFIANRITHFIHQWFWKHKQLQIEDVRRAFPVIPETNIRKHLQTICTFIRGGDMGGWWVLKENYVIPLERTLTPEDVCAYESMLAAQTRLNQVYKITRQFNPLHVRAAYTRARPAKKQGFAALECLLLKQPWFVTSSFIDAMITETPIKLQGPANPWPGVFFDLTKIPPRIVEGSVLNAEGGGEKKKRKRNVRSKLLGSGNTVLELDFDSAGHVLAAFGVPKPFPLSRWARIERILQACRELSQETTDEVDLQKFAKAALYVAYGPPNSIVYPDWSVQLRVLSGEMQAPPIKQEESEEEEVDAEMLEMERELEAMLDKDEEGDETALREQQSLPFVKKIKLVQGREVIEIITDKEAVKREIEKRQRVRTRVTKSRKDLVEDAEDVRKKRKIRDNIRRIKRDQELIGRVIVAVESGDLHQCFKETRLVCGACGLPGHMKTNKLCAEYDETKERGNNLPKGVKRAFEYTLSDQFDLATAMAPSFGE